VVRLGVERRIEHLSSFYDIYCTLLDFYDHSPPSSFLVPLGAKKIPLALAKPKINKNKNKNKKFVWLQPKGSS